MIAFVSTFYPTAPGGAEVAFGVLHHGLMEAGQRHPLFSLSARTRTDDVLPVRPLPRVPKPLKLLGVPGLDHLIARSLRPALASFDPSLVHVLDTYSLIGSLRALRGSGVPVVATWQNNVGIPHRRLDVAAPVAAWLDRREAEVIRAASADCAAVIAVSEYIARGLVQAGVPPERVVTIPVGGAVEGCHARPQPPLPPLRVLAVGRIQAHKGFDVVVRAVARLPRGDILVTIAGDGPDLPRLRRLADRLGVAHRIRFTGRVPPGRTPALYDRSHVVVVPTRTPEPFGRVAVEAMSRGRAVVAAAHGGLTEIVSRGETGVLVSPGDAEALAEALETLDRGTLERMGRNGADRCRERFHVERIAAQVAELYERTAGAGG